MIAAASASSSVRVPLAGLRRCPARRVGSTHVSCCKNDEPHQESSSFRNNLRKGFTPMKRESMKQRTGTAGSSSQVGGNAGGNNLVLGADEFSMEKWLVLDKQMNKYPGTRTFTAIGSGEDDFKNAMIKSVESVIGPVALDQVSARPSSKGAYLSVKIGPVVMTSPDEVVKIFANMKSDPRLKWFM